MQRRLALIVVASLVAAVAIITAPAAEATDTAGFAATVYQHSAGIDAGARLTLTQSCPAGTTPIAGGVSTASPAVFRYEDDVEWGDGAEVAESLQNTGATAQTATVYARCAPTSWFHVDAPVVATFAEDNVSGRAGGYASCPSGSIALSARVRWETTATFVSITASGPTADLTGWFVTGGSEGTFNTLIVDLRCVAAADVPGAFLVQGSWKNPDSDPNAPSAAHDLAASCPAGMTQLNGGTYIVSAGGSVVIYGLGRTWQTYPDGSGWHASSDVRPGYTMYVTSWCVPNQGPTLTFASGPPTYTANATAHIAFTATDPASAGGYTLTYSCSLDKGDDVACQSPLTEVVAEGSHELDVAVSSSDGRAADFAYNWTYDKTAPTATLAAPTAAFTLGGSMQVRWTGSDPDGGSGVGSYNLRLRTATRTTGFTPFQQPKALQGLTSAPTNVAVKPGTTVCFEVQAVDRAGNKSTFSAPRCTARPVDDRALTASTGSKGWARRNNAHFWNGTYSTTTKKNASLALAGVHLDRVGIVAATCATCGKVAILVKGHQIGTIDLHSTATRHQVVLALPKFTARTGSVTVKVLSSGKTVSIDGLAISRV
jgi:hypothetical protein